VSGDYTRLFYKVKIYWQKSNRSGFTRLSDGKLPVNLLSKSGMTDHLDKAKRSWSMSRIRGKNTKPEIAVRKILHAAGFRFRLHVKNLPGKPDIALMKWKTVIFVHGCYWHPHEGCSK